MARVKRAVNAHKKRREMLEQASGYRGQRSRLYRKAKEQVAALAGLRLPRPARPQGRLPQAVDPADQRRGPRGGHHLQPVHLRPQGGRGRGRPQDPGRPRRHRPGGVQPPWSRWPGPTQRGSPTRPDHLSRIRQPCCAPRSGCCAARSGSGPAGSWPRAAGGQRGPGAPSAAVEVLVADEVVERHATLLDRATADGVRVAIAPAAVAGRACPTRSPRRAFVAICRFVDVPPAEALAGSASAGGALRPGP